MAVIPVLRLLLLVRLRVFVRTLVIFRQELPPGVIFVVIPVVIILVLFIVDAVLIAALLRYGAGHNCHWRRKPSGFCAFMLPNKWQYMLLRELRFKTEF
jgi:hypothetical protein